MEVHTPQVYQQTSRFKGKPIVNYLSLYKHMQSMRLKEKDYSSHMSSHYTGDYEGTDEEKNYFTVCKPVKTSVTINVGNNKSSLYPTTITEDVWSTEKMHFLSFNDYLKYLSLKSGLEPKREYFKSDAIFQKAYDKWCKNVRENFTIVKGVNWDDYIFRNPQIQSFLDFCDTELEYEKQKMENQNRMKNTFMKMAMNNSDDGWKIVKSKNTIKKESKRPKLQTS